MAGYESDSILEKHVEHPRMIESSLIGIEDPAVKRYFLDSLQANDPALFDHIKNALNQKLVDI